MTQPLPAPNAQRFAMIGGVESFARGTTVSVFPLVMYHAWGSAAVVSQIYFVVGLVSLVMALMVPLLARVFTRRPIYIFSIVLYLVGAIFGTLGGKLATTALLCSVIAAAISFVCFNAYVLDNLDKSEFGRLETLRLFYSGLGWVVGPVMGVWLMSLWDGAPFVMVAVAALVMLTLILRTPLGRGKAIIQSPGRSSNPLAHVRRFFSQPRLVTAWLIPLARSCGWWFYFVYIGIFAVEQGLGNQVGGIAASVANMGLFLAPLMLLWMQRHSVRKAVRAGFFFGGLCFIGAALLSVLPWVTVAVLIFGTFFFGVTRYERGFAIHDGGQAFRAYRDVCGLFQFQRCLWDYFTRDCLVGAPILPSCRRFCSLRIGAYGCVARLCAPTPSTRYSWRLSHPQPP